VDKQNCYREGVSRRVKASQGSPEKMHVLLIKRQVEEKPADDLNSIKEVEQKESVLNL